MSRGSPFVEDLIGATFEAAEHAGAKVVSVRFGPIDIVFEVDVPVSQCRIVDRLAERLRARAEGEQTWPAVTEEERGAGRGTMTGES